MQWRRAARARIESSVQPVDFAGRIGFLLWMTLAACGGKPEQDAAAPERAYVPPPIKISDKLAAQDVMPAANGKFAGSSVVLVTLDTLRANHLGCYGYDKIETPHIDALAERGVLFAEAITPAPTTLPSHASMLTGLYPVNHGARANGAFRLGEHHETLAEVLAAQGYATGAAMSSFVLESRYGLDQGFDTFDDSLDDSGNDSRHGAPERVGGKTTDAALTWLREHSQERFFLWLHCFDPHVPHEPPSPYREQYAERPYDGEVAYVDAQIGRVVATLEELGRSADTLVVITADHGEGFGQHAELTHGYLLYNGTLHVPLIMACGDRLGGGVQVQRRVSLVDLMPTILGLLDIDIPEGLDGVDQSAPPEHAPPVFAETLYGLVVHDWSPLYTVFDGPHKYVHGPSPELYHLVDDYEETQNIVGQNSAEAARLRLKLSALFGAELEGQLALEANVTSDATSQRKISELGYGDLTVGDLDDKIRPDPKGMMPFLRRVEDAVSDEAGGRISTARAVAILEDVIARRPAFPATYWHLAMLFQEDGKLTRMKATLEAGLEAAPGNHMLLNELARLYLKQDRPKEAAAIARQTLDLFPNSFEPKTVLADAFIKTQAWPEARELLAELVQLAPEEEGILNNFVKATLETGTATASITILEGTLRADPRRTQVRTALVFLLGQKQRFSEALELMRQGARLNPTDLKARHTFASTLLSPPEPSLTNPGEAREIMKTLCAETSQSQPEYLFTLARAHAMLGEHNEACAAAKKAYGLAQQSGQEQLAQAAMQLGQQLGCK